MRYSLIGTQLSDGDQGDHTGMVTYFANIPAGTQQEMFIDDQRGARLVPDKNSAGLLEITVVARPLVGNCAMRRLGFGWQLNNTISTPVELDGTNAGTQSYVGYGPTGGGVALLESTFYNSGSAAVALGINFALVAATSTTPAYIAVNARASATSATQFIVKVRWAEARQA